MILYLARRLAAVAGVLLVICAVTFVIFYLLPTDPAITACGKSCSPERIAEIRNQMGLDRPIPAQFFDYVTGIFAGRTLGTGQYAIECGFPCLGYSWQSGQPVWDLLLESLPVTFSLAVGAATLWMIGGLSVGVVSALRKDTLLDRTLVVSAVAAAALPIYFVGPMLLYVVVQVLELMPYPGYTPFGEGPLAWAQNLVLAWIALAILSAAMYARQSRSSMIETMGEPYIRTARSKGLHERTVVVKHGLRAALTPIVTIFGMDLGGLMGGAIITESIFGLPGIGKLTVNSITAQDHPVVLGTTLLAAFFIVIANLVVDLLYGVVDPRVRHAS
ncbi:ABC transporter permease [Streptosporangium sp. NPDC000396]|uniref:ABC transporter permease n=1 Tax=Streptosporangium sp. NPDC000396 TaxID=3366185 RepID=UPI0036CAFF07